MTAQHQEQKINCRLLTSRGPSYDFVAQIYDGSGAQPVQHLKGVIILRAADPVDQLQQRNQSHLVGIGAQIINIAGADVIHAVGQLIAPEGYQLRVPHHMVFARKGPDDSVNCRIDTGEAKQQTDIPFPVLLIFQNPVSQIPYSRDQHHRQKRQAHRRAPGLHRHLVMIGGKFSCVKNTIQGQESQD